jgi:selenium metabolism protein YedF
MSNGDKRIRQDLVLVISNEIMGQNDLELGKILIRSFLHTLTEAEDIPHMMIFFNSGVKLIIKESPVLDDLQLLQHLGVALLACGTCLGHFNLKEKIAVGTISNMYDITRTMTRAARLINL